MAGGGEGFLVGGDQGVVLPAQGRAAAASVRSAAAALARTSWVAVSQAQASEMTRRGDPDRRTGPLGCGRLWRGWVRARRCVGAQPPETSGGCSFPAQRVALAPGKP